MSDMYKKIKKQNGEAFARTLRDYHNGLLEIEGLDEIVRYAGRDAEELLPYLMSLLASNDDAPPPKPEDPFVLLDRAGYDAFYADTLGKQNSIEKYFEKDELLCTFNDKARHQNYHIVHAVKKDADQIKREDFKGSEERQDAYGTSVISIQMLKKGGFISIKNRYNHSVEGCDNTFNSNPDNIIKGLSAALKNHFNVDFSAAKNPLPDGFVLMNGKIFKYHSEVNNIYFGDGAWARNGVTYGINKGAGEAMFDRFLFDSKTKTLVNIYANERDSFASDFNRDYGGRAGLHAKNGSLMLGNDVLIGADQSRIKTICLPELTWMTRHCLYRSHALTQFIAPALTSMGDSSLYDAHALTQFIAPALTEMMDDCLQNAYKLRRFQANALKTMENGCLYNAFRLAELEANVLTSIGKECLGEAYALTLVTAPELHTAPTRIMRMARLPRKKQDARLRLKHI